MVSCRDEEYIHPVRTGCGSIPYLVEPVEEPVQRSLFEEDPEVHPPEPGLYAGTSGWSYADWEGTLYPPGLPPGGRLARYARRYATVEIDSTFYGVPREATVRRWRRTVPRGFSFAAKFPREVTHERMLAGCEEPVERFVGVMGLLGDRLGPLLLQLPPYLESDAASRLEYLLDRLPEGPRYAVEVRHRSWLEYGIEEMLRRRGVALVLVDSPGMPRLEVATAGFVYIRLLGDRREFPSGHTRPLRDRTEDLLWWSRRMDRFLAEGREVFLYANNHYQNHSPSTVDQLLRLRGRGV